MLGRKSSPFRCGEEELASMCGGEAWQHGEEELRRHGRKSSPPWEGGGPPAREEELAGVGKSCRCWEEELARGGAPPAREGRACRHVRGRSLSAWGRVADGMGRKKSSPSVGRKSSPALVRRSRRRGEEEELAKHGEEELFGVGEEEPLAWGGRSTRRCGGGTYQRRPDDSVRRCDTGE